MCKNLTHETMIMGENTVKKVHKLTSMVNIFLMHVSTSIELRETTK